MQAFQTIIQILNNKSEFFAIALHSENPYEINRGNLKVGAYQDI